VASSSRPVLAEIPGTLIGAVGGRSKFMEDGHFDALARSLARTHSRRSLPRILGGGALAGAMLPALLPLSVEADAKKRCRRKAGAFLSRGDCRCAYKCPSAAIFPCHGNESCSCGETVEGKGFCTFSLVPNTICVSSAECPTGTKCVFTNCTGASCTTSTDCPAQFLCKRGICQQGVCYTPCPT
jgi:hypothetical protein